MSCHGVEFTTCQWQKSLEKFLNQRFERGTPTAYQYLELIIHTNREHIRDLAPQKERQAFSQYSFHTTPIITDATVRKELVQISNSNTDILAAIRRFSFFLDEKVADIQAFSEPLSRGFMEVAVATDLNSLVELPTWDSHLDPNELFLEENPDIRRRRSGYRRQQEFEPAVGVLINGDNVAESAELFLRENPDIWHHQIETESSVRDLDDADNVVDSAQDIDANDQVVQAETLESAMEVPDDADDAVDSEDDIASHYEQMEVLDHAGDVIEIVEPVRSEGQDEVNREEQNEEIIIEENDTNGHPEGQINEPVDVIYNVPEDDFGIMGVAPPREVPHHPINWHGFTRRVVGDNDCVVYQTECNEKILPCCHKLCHHRDEYLKESGLAYICPICRRPIIGLVILSV